MFWAWCRRSLKSVRVTSVSEPDVIGTSGNKMSVGLLVERGLALCKG